MSKIKSLYSPVDGKCVDISEVPDPLFAKKIMGEGVAFVYDGDTLYSPCDGVITVIASTKHAIGITSDEGLEVLLHIGTNTVDLAGNGFNVLVKKDQKVKVGTPLLKIDRKFMQEKNINLITPMVITNHNDFDINLIGVNQEVRKGESEILTYNKVHTNVSLNKNMKYEQLCNDIIQNIGGKDNVITVTHCVTRLRFKLKDESKANTEMIQKNKGVVQVIQTGGQYQVVIGTHVEDVYKELVELGGFTSEEPLDIDEGDGTQTKGAVSKFLVLMSGIFQPILGVLMACGMIKALLVLGKITGILDVDGGTYVLLSALGDALFYFFPVAIGWSAAKKFGLKDIYGITLGACLTYPTIVALSGGEALYTIFTGTIFEASVFTEFLGIPVILPGAGYANSVIPIIIIVWVASLIFKYLNKHVPAMVKSFVVPFVTLIVTFVLGMLVIGPVAMMLQGLLGEAIKLIININTGLAGLVIGSLWSILVMFGLHMPIIMMFNVNIAEYGYDIINPLIFSGALATMGAVLGVIIRTKNSEERNLYLPALFSTFFGVNEPSLYGVLIPRRKIMFSCFLASGIGSMIAGFCGSKLYAFGTSGPLGLPCFINPTGIDMGFIGLCVGAVVSFVLALIFALVIGAKKDEKAIQIGK